MTCKFFSFLLFKSLTSLFLAQRIRFRYYEYLQKRLAMHIWELRWKREKLMLGTKSLTEIKETSAQVRLEASDTKGEPNLQVLSIICLVDLICHLWQQYVNTVLLPLASSSVTVRREMVAYNNQCINRIETSSNQLLQRLTDGEF